MREIYLAGGCFWGVEAFFMRMEGVTYTEVGYANSTINNPSYEDVCSGKTMAAETVKVEYDYNKVSLKELLNSYFRIINPYLLNRQGNDIGTQYRTGIYYTNTKDLCIISEFINQKQDESLKKIVVEVESLKNFYKAEEYHQHYLVKNPEGYCHIKLD